MDVIFTYLTVIVATLFLLSFAFYKKGGKIDNFAGKQVLITGASSGLGRALAIKLSALGARCVLIAIDQEGLDETAAMCTRPETHVLIKADLSQAGETDAIIQRFTGYKFVFQALCAGLGSSGIKAPTGKIYTLFALNCAACAALATGIDAHRTLLMASPQAFLPLPNRSHYAASKAACLYLARCLALDGVDCLVAMPMWFYSNLRQNAIGNSTGQARKTAKGAHTAESVADEIICAAMHGKREVCLDFKQRAGRLAYAFFPGVVEAAVLSFVKGNQ